MRSAKFAKPSLNAAILTPFSPLITGREARSATNQPCFGLQSMHLLSSCVLKNLNNTGVSTAKQGKVIELSTSQRSSDAAIVDGESMKGERFSSSDFAFTDSKIELIKNTRNFSTDSPTCRTLVAQLDDKGRMKGSLHQRNIYLNPVIAGRRTDCADTRFKTFSLNLTTIIHTVQDFKKQRSSSSFTALSSERAIEHHQQHKSGKMTTHRSWISQADIGQGRHVSNAVCNVMSDLIVRKLHSLMISICNNFIFQTLSKRYLVFSRVSARESAPGIGIFNTSHNCRGLSS